MFSVRASYKSLHRGCVTLQDNYVIYSRDTNWVHPAVGNEKRVAMKVAAVN